MSDKQENISKISPTAISTAKKRKINIKSC